GVLYARDLGGQLLDQVRYTRFNGRSSPDQEKCGDDPDDEDDDAGPPIGQLRHLRWIYPDHLGSTSLITNAHGRRLDRMVYGPWGEKLAGNFARTRFGYTGHAREERTGYWYSVHRYLDPRAGRWTQQDPRGRVNGLNVYSYVRNGPLSAVDPMGLRLLVRWDNLASDFDTFFGWTTTLSRLPLEQKLVGDRLHEISFGCKETPTASTPAGIAVKAMIDTPHTLVIALTRDADMDFDSYNRRTIDMKDLEALYPAPPPQANLLTRDEILTHILAEYSLAQRFGATDGPAFFWSAHEYGSYLEYLYRSSRGGAGRRLEPAERLGPDFRIDAFSNGSATKLPRVGYSFGVPQVLRP
ncbi:MAG: RHS repeat-associated core domain-containing protein, partial [Candidatus Riflebacteria bacterium]|nr:RHS repeat-associated core domain-containing protein [Candidatus Riflebacteria bacterium]